MNRREQNPEEVLDRIIGEIRDEHIADGQVEESSRRVWERIANQRQLRPAFNMCGFSGADSRLSRRHVVSGPAHAPRRPCAGMLDMPEDSLRVNRNPAAKLIETARSTNDAYQMDGDRGVGYSSPVAGRGGTSSSLPRRKEAGRLFRSPTGRLSPAQRHASASSAGTELEHEKCFGPRRESRQQSSCSTARLSKSGSGRSSR